MGFRKLLVLAACLAIPACTATFPVVGSFDAYNEVFRGEVNSDLMSGRSFIEVTAKNSGIKCQGRSRTLHIPASNTIANMFLIPYCEGQKGDARLICSDGRVISATWTAETCTSGYGSGYDQHGAMFQFAFGMSDEEAKKRFRSEVSRAAKRPAFPSYRPKETRKAKGFATGTAFLVTRDGHLVTNFHVIEDASDIYLLVRGKEVPAKVVARDPGNDVAVLKADVHGVPIRLPGEVRFSVAEEVMTLGYPLIDLQGQALKASFGRINALSGLGDDPRFVQIDVPIQPGNSGGPLINARGELVGIVTATLNQVVALRESGSLPQNVNYAVKTDYVAPLLKDLATDREAGQKHDFQVLVERYRGSVFLVVAK